MKLPGAVTFGKARDYFFHLQQQMLRVKYFSICCKLKIFRLLWLSRMNEWKENKHSNVANFFYSKVPKLPNLTNGNKKKPETITSSPYKKKVQQEQEKQTKIKQSQIKQKQIKPKFKLKQPVETKKQNKLRVCRKKGT